MTKVLRLQPHRKVKVKRKIRLSMKNPASLLKTRQVQIQKSGSEAYIIVNSTTYINLDSLLSKLTMELTKGQIVSKCLSGVIVSSNKPTTYFFKRISASVNFCESKCPSLTLTSSNFYPSLQREVEIKTLLFILISPN